MHADCLIMNNLCNIASQYPQADDQHQDQMEEEMCVQGGAGPVRIYLQVCK